MISPQTTLCPRCERHREEWERHANWISEQKAGWAFMLLRDERDRLREVLNGLLSDIQEYQRINNLGGENNHWQVRARAALENVNG